MIQIPFSGDTESTIPLVRCIERAAREMHMSEPQVALIMSHFMEELAHQVASNHAVRIPGFGVFGLKVWNPRHDPQALPYCYPAFSGNLPFRNLVRSCASAYGPAVEAIDRHRRHNHPSSHKDRGHRAAWSAQQAFRERISAQARRLGYET